MNKLNITNTIILICSLIFMVMSYLIANQQSIVIAQQVLFYSSIFTLTISIIQSFTQIDYLFFSRNKSANTTWKTNKRILISMSTAIIVTLLVFIMYLLHYDNGLLSSLRDFSNRGGFWAISLALLMLNLLREQWKAEAEDLKKKNDVALNLNKKQMLSDKENEILKIKLEIAEKKLLIEEKKQNKK